MESYNIFKSTLLETLSSDPTLENNVLNAYGFKKDTKYSDSEVLNIIIKTDFANLFIMALIKIDFDHPPQISSLREFDKLIINFKGGE